MKRKHWLLMLACLLLLIGVWHLVTSVFREEEKQIRTRLRETVKERFPEQTAEYFQTFGLFRFAIGRESTGAPSTSGKAVVLVHGLDDPGKVWQVLAPTLSDEGFDVWLFEYPNDQPVAESARMFFEKLEALPENGIRRIDLVAHSMGGLVSRDMLTSPGIDYGRWAEEQRVPTVDSLTMVGTPNHGSHVARIRVLGEVRDHLARLARGQAQWLGGILDGAGEAKIDLLPGSRFLTELNARPYPERVSMLVIAGVSTPWSVDDIQRWLNDVRAVVPESGSKQVDALGAHLTSMTRGLGDGLVAVDSTRLAGVPHRTVDGTHLTMIRNVTKSSRRVPPAVPIIVQRLKKE